MGIKNKVQSQRLIKKYMDNPVVEIDDTEMFDPAVYFWIKGNIKKDCGCGVEVGSGKDRIVLIKSSFGDTCSFIVASIIYPPKNHVIYKKHLLEMSPIEAKTISKEDLFFKYTSSVYEYYTYKFKRWIDEC